MKEIKNWQIDLNYGRGSHSYVYFEGDLEAVVEETVKVIKAKRVRPLNVSVFEYSKVTKEKFGVRQVFFNAYDVRSFRSW